MNWNFLKSGSFNEIQIVDVCNISVLDSVMSSFLACNGKTTRAIVVLERR